MTSFRRLHHPATYALAAILATEVAARAAVPGVLPDRFDPHRNPYARRNWDAYTRWTSDPGRRKRGEVRVLLLANSQGRGPEHPSDRIYAAQLEKRLVAATGAPIRVVNWSFGPNRVPEAILLLARARDLDPDVVIAVFPGNWFQAADYAIDGVPTPLQTFPSDLPDSAWWDRHRVPAQFAEHYLRPVRAIDGLIWRALPTYRYRDLPLSALAHRYEWIEAFMPQAERAAWYLRGTSSQARVTSRAKADLKDAWPHPAILQMFTDAAAPLRAHKVFVLQPHHYDVDGGEAIVRAIHGHLRRQGWTVWDLSDAVPTSEFLQGSVHLTEEGHEMVAAVLTEGLRGMLPRPVVSPLP